MADKVEYVSAIDDSGTHYTIRKITYEIIGDKEINGRPQKPVYGMTEYFLQDGSSVNEVNSDVFEIVQTGKRLRRT